MSFLKSSSPVGVNHSYNYSAFAIPAMWVITMAPHFYAAALSKGKFENRHPREYLNSIRQKAKKEPWEKKYVRAEAAQQNGWESFGLFAAAIAIGNAAKLPVGDLNFYAATYLISRVAFNLLYINSDSESMAKFRSISWLAGIFINFTLFVKSGLAMNRVL